ncbi:UNVERIFIED_CONTAM: putative mitochondrial protein [Sesamum radiatum]|uniref:Mitochondrial protein n=1 Tax=Sesamum radiatum TaxID=300843 RepID=A0AAW2VMQ1_SESRA
MLAKQMWRIIATPHSLLSSVLRARYFPDGQVLTAVSGRNPSFTWRSILAAQHVVRGGLRWRIGLGRSVHIWDDPWIPRPFSFRILTPRYVNAPNSRVCDLIDASTKAWNCSLVHELFWRDEAELILAIPISALDGEDFIVWHHTSGGKFSVRSAYHVAASLANQSQPSSSLPSSPFGKFYGMLMSPKRFVFLHGDWHRIPF